MDDTQTVVEEPKVEVTPQTAEVPDAQKPEIDLDKLLKEFEPKEPATATDKEVPEAAKTTEGIDELLEYVRLQKVESTKETERRIAEEYKATVTSLKGDLPLSEKVVDGYLRLRAQEDQRILTAYQYRAKNPETWKKVEEGIRNELRENLKKAPDPVSTSTRNQVAEAIKNAQSTGGEIATKPLHEMSDAEFNHHFDKMVRG